MPDLKIVTLKEKSQLEKCYPVLKEMRQNLSLEDFHMIYQHAHEKDGFEFVALQNAEGEILSLMGYRFLYDYVHGKHLYIDDLVTTQNHRSKGLGARLLAYAEKCAQENGCKGLRLCTGTQNTEGIKFYQRNQWAQPAVVFKKGFHKPA